MPYWWLPVGLDLAHLHGLEPYEVDQVLHAKVRRPVPVISPEGWRFVEIWGATAAGRPLIVTVKPSGWFDAAIVAARPMDGEEVEQWETWIANRK